MLVKVGVATVIRKTDHGVRCGGINYKCSTRAERGYDEGANHCTHKPFLHDKLLRGDAGGRVNEENDISVRMNRLGYLIFERKEKTRLLPNLHLILYVESNYDNDNDDDDDNDDDYDDDNEDDDDSKW